MELTPTPDRRAMCEAKLITPGNCLMKKGGHVVYLVTEVEAGMFDSE